MTNGTPTNLYVPSDIGLGGQRTSSSQLACWATCRQECFLRYWCPHPEVPDSSGLRHHVTSDGLLTGSFTHEALHAYKLSAWRDGCDTGEYNLDKALEWLDSVAATRAKEAESPEQHEENLATAKLLLMKFDETRSTRRQYRVVADANGDPVLEREFHMPVGNGYLYVVKVDGVVMNDEGYHLVEEDKTSAASWAQRTLDQFSMRGQSYGLMGVLFSNWPTAPLNGILARVLVKNRGKTSKLPTVMEREIVVPAENVEHYLENVGYWVAEIDQSIAAWESEIEEGHDAFSAGLRWFPMDGLLNGSCFRYNRACDFLPYCENHGLGSRALRGYRPRMVAGEPYKDTDDMEENYL